jgi:hypothetical protein
MMAASSGGVTYSSGIAQKRRSAASAPSEGDAVMTAKGIEIAGPSRNGKNQTSATGAPSARSTRITKENSVCGQKTLAASAHASR